MNNCLLKPAYSARTAAWLLAFCLGLASSVSAIVMRDDVEDAAYIAHGKKFPATVKIMPAGPGRGKGDEGTLIASRWVLTAAHVANQVRPGDQAIVGGSQYAIKRLIKHPEWASNADMNVDIALLELSEVVTGVEVASPFCHDYQVGDFVVFAGRGGNGTGLGGPTEEDGQLRAASNRIEKIGDTWLRFRFDSPSDPGVTELEGISGPGDSGGPGYLMGRDRLCVIGVSSGQDTEPAGGKEGHYGVLEYYSRVMAFEDWLRKVLDSKGNEDQ